MIVGTVLTMWYFVVFLEKQQNTTLSGQFQNPIEKQQNTTLSGQFQQPWWYFVVFHGCWNCPDSVVFCCFSIGFWDCPDSVVFCCFSWLLELS
jgi:hypothetical protein